MTHYYEKNIVEIKNEYTDFLSNILTPLIYEGISSMYSKAMNYEEEYINASKENPQIKNPGVLRLFQSFLKGIPKLNNHIIETETARLKDNSKCSDIFDDLIKAVVKSNIILLTFNASGKRCKLVNEKYHETVDTKLFIHKCYIECGRIFYNYPELFWHGYTTLDIKRNQREAHKLIKNAIIEAIRKILPIKAILEEYMNNDYITDNNENDSDENNSKYLHIKNMVDRDLKGDEYADIGENLRALTSSSESENLDEIENLNNDIDNLDKLIVEKLTHEDEFKVQKEESQSITNNQLGDTEEFNIRKNAINFDDIFGKKKRAPKKSMTTTGIQADPIQDDMIEKVYQPIQVEQPAEQQQMERPMEEDMRRSDTQIEEDIPIIKSKTYNKTLNDTDDRNVFFDALLNQ